VIDQPFRPVLRWLHGWAVATAIATLVLLALGQLVTSFQAGMADPIWPTEPWYLLMIDWLEPSRGYLIEHTHRIAAFTVGGMVLVLALGLWWTDPNRTTRWLGLAALVLLIAGFGQFHRGLIAQRSVAPTDVRLPLGGTAVTLLGLVGVLSLASVGLALRTCNSLPRFLGVVALVGVMIQGLFGGFRVLLNELVGADLAIIHGIFAQVVFCLLIAIAILCGPRQPVESEESRGGNLIRRSLILVAVIFAHIVLGALVRHSLVPHPTIMRLHLLTAFVATGLAIWLLIGIAARPQIRVRVGFAFGLLGLVLALQLVLGVEAWMERFGQYTLPELVKITTAHAAIRTAHAFVGSCLLGTAVVMALRLGRPTGQEIPTSDRTDSRWFESGGYENRMTVSSARGEVS
jgi:heme A synthase